MPIRKVSASCVLLSAMLFLSGIEAGCSQQKTDAERSSTLVAGGRLAVPTHTEPTVRLVVSTPEPGFTDTERQLASQALERVRTRLQPILEQSLEVEYDEKIGIFIISKKHSGGILLYLHTPRRWGNELRLSITTRDLHLKAAAVVQEEMMTLGKALNANEVRIDENR